MMTILENIHWKPGIGDPTLVAWITTILYFIVAYGAMKCGLHERNLLKRNSCTVFLWWFFALLLVFLGFNKELDLQSLLIQIGGVSAKQFGVYEQRREIQRVFIIIFSACSIVIAGFTVKMLVHDFRKYSLLCLGICIISAFIILRAASMNHIHLVPGAFISVGGLQMKYVMELFGLAVIGAGEIYCMKKRL